MRQHLLVVDDEQPICDLLELYLSKQGYQVSTCTTATQALQLLQQPPLPDLVVLDISLNGEDGLQVLQQIKTRWPGLPVVMLTGMGYVEDLLQEAHRKGADGYVSKVLPLDELLGTIQRVLKPEGIAA
jgi:DNA-binding response OmpR family regulator